MSENKILILDDSKVFLLFLKHIIDKIPNTLSLTLQDPRDILKTTQEFKPDIVLTDFQMPYLNGNEICQILKSNTETSLIPIMMLTSSSSEDQLIKAIEFGADEFICKSSSKEVISIKVKSMLRYKKLMDANIQLKQAEAVTALIATSSHEFNNALCISNLFIKKLKQNKALKEDKKVIDKIVAMNERMLKVVRKLEKMRTVSLIGTDKEVKMLKL